MDNGMDNMKDISLPSGMRAYPEIVRVEASAGAGKTRHHPFFLKIA